VLNNQLREAVCAEVARILREEREKKGLSMTRLAQEAGLSQAMIIIESGLEGGTFEAGKTALELGAPLFCVEYSEPFPSAAGNPYFLQHGAFSLRRSRSGQPNLAKVISVVRDGSLPAAKHGLPVLPAATRRHAGRSESPAREQGLLLKEEPDSQGNH